MFAQVRVPALIALFFALAAAAGCGGDDPADPAAPAGAPGADPESGPAPASTPTRGAQQPGGIVWKTYNRVSGMETFSLEGEPWRRVSPKLSDLAPTFDGKRYAYARPLHSPNIPFEQAPAFDNQTEVGVVETESGQTIHQVTLTANISRARPSPVNPALVLAFAAPFGSQRGVLEWIVIDVAQQKIVTRFPGWGWATWLPDGSYMQLLPDGKLRVGSADSTGAPFGALAVPPGAVVGDRFSVNPQGTRIAVPIYTGAGNVDIYVANLDGSKLERFTKTGMSSYGIWSPDGGHLLFDYDSDAPRCGEKVTLTCSHPACEIHFAAESARDVAIDRTAKGSSQLSARGQTGSPYFVPCKVIAWTPHPPR